MIFTKNQNEFKIHHQTLRARKKSVCTSWSSIWYGRWLPCVRVLINFTRTKVMNARHEFLRLHKFSSWSFCLTSNQYLPPIPIQFKIYMSCEFHLFHPKFWIHRPSNRNSYLDAGNKARKSCIELFHVNLCCNSVSFKVSVFHELAAITMHRVRSIEGKMRITANVVLNLHFIDNDLSSRNSWLVVELM